MTPKEVLLRAADLIERDGWGQGAMFDEDGAPCTYGALISVGGDLAGDQACKVLATNLEVTSVVDWNDSLSPETGKATVLAALRGAAESCDK